jgi:hypothetical protein
MGDYSESKDGRGVAALADFFSPIREDLVLTQFGAQVVREQGERETTRGGEGREPELQVLLSSCQTMLSGLREKKEVNRGR